MNNLKGGKTILTHIIGTADGHVLTMATVMGANDVVTAVSEGRVIESAFNPIQQDLTRAWSCSYRRHVQHCYCVATWTQIEITVKAIIKAGQ